MAESTVGIDTSVLDDLIAIRRQQALLTDFKLRAEQRRGDVEPQVFDRVMRDYAARADALAAKAAPLEARARAEYRTLQATIARIEQTRNAARLDKAEVEFRHEVGEIDDAELAARLEGPASIIGRCDQELRSIDEVKARFAEAYPDIESALGDEASSEAAPPSADAEPPAAAAAPEPASEGPGSTDAGVVELASAQVADAAPEPAPAAPEPLRVVVADAEAADVAPPLVPAAGAEGPSARTGQPVTEPPVSAAQAPALDVEQAPPEFNLHQAPTQLYAVPEHLLVTEAEIPSSSQPAQTRATEDHGDEGTRGEEATFILPEAVLRLIGPTPTEFRLGALNYIGRADDNQIRLKSADVSRRHAVISVVEGGFVLRDLQSQNGSYVNGHRVTEQRLSDGDVVRIGNIELSFVLVSGRLGSAGGPGVAMAAPHA